MVDAYNDTLDEISDATEFYEQSVVIRRRKKAAYVDLRGLLPTGALRVTSVWDISMQQWLHPTTVRELDQMVGRGWEKNAGLSKWWFMRGLWFLGTHPVPNDDTTSLKVYFSATMPHVDISGGLANGLNVTPPIQSNMDTLIDYYMLSSLLADFKESKKAVEFYSLYQETETEIRNTVKNRMVKERSYRMGARR